MLKIAHRGAKGYAVENTLVAFQKALDMGADGIELDVLVSSDGHLVVFHDEALDRLTNGTGLVSELTLTEIQSFRILEAGTQKASDLRIPTLAEVLDVVDGQCLLNIELKIFDAADKVAALIENYVSQTNWTYDNFIVSSFDWNALQQIAFVNEQIPIGVLTETNLDLAIAFAKFIRAKAIHPHFHLLDEINTQKIQDKGFLVFPWTINHLEDIQKIKNFNVNGIITDFTDRI